MKEAPMAVTLTKAEERTRTMLADFINEKHPVALAVEPTRQKAVDAAAAEAKKIVAKVREELKASGFDLLVCAPYPNSGMGRATYMTAQAKYQLFSSLTKWRKGTYSPREPHLADVTPELVAKFIAKAKERAAIDFDAFIVKLVQKIGACKKAELTGDFVWSYSFLAVDKVGGVREVWKTQQIINVSKLGRLFNQWPTRLMKPGKMK
jgi:hypothetical protein